MTLSLARGTLRYAQGRAREAADDLVELHERKQRWGIGGNVMIQAGAYGALALAACGERDQARALAEADLASARRWGAPTPQCLALCALGAAIGGGEGLALLEEAATLLGEPPSAHRRSRSSSWARRCGGPTSVPRRASRCAKGSSWRAAAAPAAPPAAPTTS